MRCPNSTCDQDIRSMWWSYCPKCGQALRCRCIKCRRELDPSWDHCPYCGINTRQDGNIEIVPIQGTIKEQSSVPSTTNSTVGNTFQQNQIIDPKSENQQNQTVDQKSENNVARKKLELPKGCTAFMVRCPSGQFTMGTDNNTVGTDSRPAHQVIIPHSYWIWETPVTKAQYYAVMFEEEVQDERLHPITQISIHEAASFCNKLSEKYGMSAMYIIKPDNHRSILIQKEWDKAKTTADNYCQTYGFRLPTEAEWEYACVAPPQDFAPEQVQSYAWCKENSNGQIKPVATRQANSWGIFDMLGNVMEWVMDHSLRQYPPRSENKTESENEPPEVNPFKFDLSMTIQNKPNTKRVVRGGDARTPYTSTLPYLRSTRNGDSKDEYLGFRPVLFDPEK